MLNEKLRNYRIVARYLDRGVGWRKNETRVEDATLQTAGREASRIAKALDEQYADDHFWTVDIYNADNDESGSYYQLFHGRLS